MPGHMVACLHGVQGGDEGAFTRLYAQTNPVLLRYLRVVSELDPAPLALTTWSTLLHVIPTFDADDDDDWLELAIGTARRRAGAAAGRATPGTHSPAAAAAGGGRAADPIDDVIATLRACGPASADVLAMHVVAGLGRDSIARIIGSEPSEVLERVHHGQGRLALPLEGLMTMARLPGTPAEVDDLPAALPLFAARFGLPLRSTPPYVSPVESSAEPPAVATPRTASGPAGPAGPLVEATVVDLLNWDAAPPTTSRVVMRRTVRPPGPSRLTRAGAGAAAWVVAVAGIGAAAAMSGVIPAVIDNFFGDDGRSPVITAQGPARPDGVPSRPDGGDDSTSPPSGEGPDRQPPGDQPQPVGQGIPDDVIVGAVSASTVVTTRVVLVSAALTDGVPAPSSPATPSAPGVTPPPTTPGPGSGPVPGSPPGKGDGKGDGNRDGNRDGKGGGKDRPQSGSRHDKAKAAKVKAVKVKAAKAKAAKAAKVKAAKVKAAKVKAAKVKAAKAAKCAKARAKALAGTRA